MPDQQSMLQAAVRDRYLIEQEIGRGGAAFVFRARDLQHGRSVAIKLLRPEFSLSSERFLREITIVARLQHPNIVPLFDSGRADEVPYYVMPLIAGESLRERLERDGKLPFDEAIDIALEVADALAHAHGQGLLHRDVKPDNILLASGHAMLADFGIARAITQSMDTRATGSGIAVGTPAYMSPEQASGDDMLDHRSDQYSLACVVHEMLSGHSPRRSRTPGSALKQVIGARSGELRALRPEVPASVSTAVSRALADDPEERFESIEEFARALAGEPRSAEVLPWSRSHRLRAGRTHEGRLKRVAMWSVALGLAAAGVWYLAPGGLGGDAPGTSEAARILDPRRIAVLYFDDHSPERSLEYLASGLTESLIHQLKEVPSLEVISRNGVKRFRSEPVAPESIATLLNVGSIVEGSVQRSGNRLRVRVKLVDARTGASSIGSDLEREFGELFLLEDDLARSVASDLRRQIGEEVRVRERAAGTRSARARELVWRADELRDEADSLASSREAAAVRHAVVLGHRADSLLAAAEQADGRWIAPVIDRGWVELELAGRQSGDAAEAALRRSLGHAERALARDATAAAALELRGTWLYRSAERGRVSQQLAADYLRRAEMDLRQAIARDSMRSSAWGTLSRVRRAAGDVVEAERAAIVALSMDAFLTEAPSILQALFSASLMRDSIAASWRWCERGAREYPRDAAFLQCQLTLVAEDLSRPPDVARATALLAELKRLDPDEAVIARGRPWLPIYREMMLGIVLARAGRADSARAIQRRASERVRLDPVMQVDLKYEEALLALVLGDRPRAIVLLEEYLRARPFLRGLVEQHPRWKPLRADPAFVALIAGPAPQ